MGICKTKLDNLQEGLPYEFTGFRVVRNEGILSGNGELYFDNMLLYDAPILSVPEILKGKINIYPNPASEIIYVQIENEEIPTLQLCSLNGKLLKETKALEMNIQGIVPGTYILIININRQKASMPVIIK